MNYTLIRDQLRKIGLGGLNEVRLGLIGRNLRKESKIGQAKSAGLLSIIEESISGLRIIKAFTAIDYSTDALQLAEQTVRAHGLSDRILLKQENLPQSCLR